MEGIRALHKQDPETFSLEVLSKKFRLSPEAVRRILKSRWKPSPEREALMVMKERKARAERIKATKEEEMHQMVRAGIKLKTHPDDELALK